MSGRTTRSIAQCARELDQRVSEMKERTGILQVDKVLSIVALNLSFELMQEQQKTHLIEDVLKNKILRPLDHSLENITGQKLNSY